MNRRGFFKTLFAILAGLLVKPKEWEYFVSNWSPSIGGEMIALDVSGYQHSSGGRLEVWFDGQEITNWAILRAEQPSRWHQMVVTLEGVNDD